MSELVNLVDGLFLMFAYLFVGIVVPVFIGSMKAEGKSAIEVLKATALPGLAMFLIWQGLRWLVSPTGVVFMDMIQGAVMLGYLLAGLGLIALGVAERRLGTLRTIAVWGGVQFVAIPVLTHCVR